MRVSVTQRWRQGLPIEERELQMTDTSVIGHLKVALHQKGERYAALESRASIGEAPRDLLPRLWDVSVVQVDGRRMKLRGTQRHDGRAYLQEWDCYVLARQD